MIIVSIKSSRLVSAQIISRASSISIITKNTRSNNEPAFVSFTNQSKNEVVNSDINQRLGAGIRTGELN